MSRSVSRGGSLYEGEQKRVGEKCQVKIGFFSVLRTQIAVFIHFLEISDLLFEFVVFYFMIGHITVKFLLVPSCTSEVVSEYGPASFQCSMSYPYGRPLLLNEGH